MKHVSSIQDVFRITVCFVLQNSFCYSCKATISGISKATHTYKRPVTVVTVSIQMTVISSQITFIRLCLDQKRKTNARAASRKKKY